MRYSCTHRHYLSLPCILSRMSVYVHAISHSSAHARVRARARMHVHAHARTCTCTCSSFLCACAYINQPRKQNAFCEKVFGCEKSLCVYTNMHIIVCTKYTAAAAAAAPDAAAGGGFAFNQASASIANAAAGRPPGRPAAASETAAAEAVSKTSAAHKSGHRGYTSKEEYGWLPAWPQDAQKMP